MAINDYTKYGQSIPINLGLGQSLGSFMNQHVHSIQQGAENLWATATTTSSDSSTLATIPWEYINLQQAQPAYANDYLGPKPSGIKFFRINQQVERPEFSVMEEPLDELRIKVAKWLRGKL